MGQERGGIVGHELKAVSNAERIIKGYASIFDVADAQGDRVKSGAFARTLKQRTPMMLWQHNTREPLGVWDVLREDRRGLYVEGRLADTTRGRDVYELFRIKAIRGLSIGYGARNFIKNQTGGRDLFDVDLYEISPVSFASCPNAEIDSVKTQNRLEAAIERLNKAIGEMPVPRPAPKAIEPTLAWRMAVAERFNSSLQPQGKW